MYTCSLLVLQNLQYVTKNRQQLPHVCFEVTVETKSLSQRFVKISYDLRLLLVDISIL